MVLPQDTFVDHMAVGYIAVLEAVLQDMAANTAAEGTAAEDMSAQYVGLLEMIVEDTVVEGTAVEDMMVGKVPAVKLGRSKKRSPVELPVRPLRHRTNFVCPRDHRAGEVVE